MRMAGCLLLVAACAEPALQLEVARVDALTLTADGCAARLDTLVLGVAPPQLLDGAGLAEAPPGTSAQVMLVPEDRVSLPPFAAPPGQWAAVRLGTRALDDATAGDAARVDEGGGLRLALDVTCADTVVRLDAVVSGPVTQDCTGPWLATAPGTALPIRWRVAWTRLFAADAADPAGSSRALAPWHAADADGDGALTVAELEAVDATASGLRPAALGGVSLAGWLSALSGTVAEADDLRCAATTGDAQGDTDGHAEAP